MRQFRNLDMVHFTFTLKKRGGGAFTLNLPLRRGGGERGTKLGGRGRREGETSKWYKRGDQNMEEGQITGGEEERGVTTSPLCGIQYSGTSKIEDTTCLSIVGRLSSFGGPP